MFFKVRVPVFRKRRVSVTRMGASETYPSNHGTKPKPSSVRDLVRSPPMATATATAQTAPQYASATSATPPSAGKTPASPFMHFPVTVERDELWVQQLQQQQNQRFETQAEVMYQEYLADLSAAGAFATEETKAEIKRRFDGRLDYMRQMQQEELEQHIEIEKQERLWSIGQQDSSWEGWLGLYEEQKSILASIKRDAARSSGIYSGDRSLDEKIRENQEEREHTLRNSEEWQQTEAARLRDRQRWAEAQRMTSYNIGERRQRDMAEAAAIAAGERAREEQTTRLAYEVRQGAEQLRARASRPALNTDFESSGRPILSEASSRASVSDSIFSSSSSTADTAASSVPNERWHPSESALPRPSASRPIPVSSPVQEELRRSASGSYSGSSPPTRARLSSAGTPTSNNMPHARREDSPQPERWIPPETAREPTRKGSTQFSATGEPTRRGSSQFDGTNEPTPVRKASMLFGASPAPAPLPSLDEPSRWSQPQPQPPRPGPSSQLPPQPRQAPPTQSQPQPQQSTTTRPSQPQSRPTSSQAPPPHAPNAPGMRSQPLPQTQPKPQPQFGAASVPRSHTYPGQSPSSASFPTSHTTPPKTAPKAAPAPSPANLGARPTPAAKSSATAEKPSPPVDAYRTKLRAEYVQQEEQRVEEERRRREQETNERRAEDARRRGAEKRRKEELEREAERREAERKARKNSTANMGPMLDRPVIEVWNAYEAQWAAMASASQLRFRSIPWPVLMPVFSPDMLLPIHIAAFVLNEQHSQGKSRKDRLKEALLRWHPDRFESKWLKKVVEEERDIVQEGVGHVVRALNELLSTDSIFSG